MTVMMMSEGGLYQTRDITLISHHSHLQLMSSVRTSRLNTSTQKIWITQPGSGLDKRQCTLQIVTRAEGEQPRIAIIFRGQGKRISLDEKIAWHQDVDVYWQCNAWADTKVSLEWVKGMLSKSVQGLNRFALFLDNLKSQESDEFKSAVAALNGVAWFGLKNATDLWQVADAGLT